MNRHLSAVIPLACAMALALGASQALAKKHVNDEPLRDKWAPSEWGPDDKAGAVNRTTAKMVLQAIKLVKQGKVATLGKVYQQDAPAFGSRGWRMTIPGLPTAGPFGPQLLTYNDEYLATEIGQIGTQFDGPGHIGVITSKGIFHYNGRLLSDPGINAYGVGPLGVEYVAKKGFVCRGVLLDGVAYNGGKAMPIPVSRKQSDPGIVSAKDIQAMIKRQRLGAINEGDCVFLHTGHGDLWHPSKWDSFSAAEKQKRVAKFNSGEPGLGVSACEYLASRKIILTGGDTWGVDAVGPGFGGETEQPFECHIKLQTKRGIWNLENLDFSQLIADKVYQFLFVWSPLKIKGGTGSPGNPVALY